MIFHKGLKIMIISEMMVAVYKKPKSVTVIKEQ